MQLQDAITVNVCFPNRSNDDEPRGANLWKFCPEGQTGMNGVFVKLDDCTADTVHGKTYIKEIYELAGIDDQTSVPILFDKQTNTVVNNESAEILRMMSTVLSPYVHNQKLKLQSPSDDNDNNTFIDLYPTELRDEIDRINDWIYKDIANGSYKAGFSSNQDAYETAYKTFFAALQELNDNILSQSDFLVGNKVTEADVRLFPALYRFDPVYYSRFKLNQSFLWEYPNLWAWMSRMMALPGMESVTNAAYLQHCKQGYFGRTGNGTVPVGPLGYPECYKQATPPFVKTAFAAMEDKM